MAGDSSVDLNGTRALVTGGTSGIGLALAEALARADASVVLTSRSAERATAAAARLPGALGVAADARDEVSVARAAELTLIDPAVMGPPIVWLASPQARDVHDERIVATGFEAWLAGHAQRSA